MSQLQAPLQKRHLQGSCTRIKIKMQLHVILKRLWQKHKAMLNPLWCKDSQVFLQSKPHCSLNYLRVANSLDCLKSFDKQH